MTLPWSDFSELSAFIQVVVIDITLAGDNAIVVGMAAAGLAACDRRRAIMIGIVIATGLRILFAVMASEFLQVIGLTLAGGVLLLWVAWKMLREIIGERQAAAAFAGRTAAVAGAPGTPRKGMGTALLQIVVADVSMSLDNVLAVAGTARFHVWVLVAGLALSVALMGAASTLVARLLQRYHWIVWLGFGIVTYVAMSMIYDGWREVHAHLAAL